MRVLASIPYFSKTLHRGITKNSDHAQDIINELKEGEEWATNVCAEWVSEHPVLIGIEGTLVAAPRSKEGKPSNMKLMRALVKRGIGTEVLDLVKRVKSVESSRLKRRAAGTPAMGVTLDTHLKSMGIKHCPAIEGDIWIVDDLVTQGTTMMAVAMKLQEAGYTNKIQGIAAGYLLEDTSEIYRCPLDHVSVEIDVVRKCARQDIARYS